MKIQKKKKKIGWWGGGRAGRGQIRGGVGEGGSKVWGREVKLL